MDNKTNQSIRTLENALNNENLDQIEFDLVEDDNTYDPNAICIPKHIINDYYQVKNKFAYEIHFLNRFENYDNYYKNCDSQAIYVPPCCLWGPHTSIEVVLNEETPNVITLNLDNLAVRIDVTKIIEKFKTYDN